MKVRRRECVLRTGPRPIIAGLLLTTEALVAERPEKTPAPAGPPGGMPDY
jgi:hypothetical protein